ncbi:MAG TPA: hypothetical protein VE999_01170 [Gemmataceae bacterium]|nr:hypothetical protein [Gemmataceae bacterium]
MEGFIFGLFMASVIIGFILRAVGKSEETNRAIKDGGLKALQWWLRK